MGYKQSLVLVRLRTTPISITIYQSVSSSSVLYSLPNVASIKKSDKDLTDLLVVSPLGLLDLKLSSCKRQEGNKWVSPKSWRWCCKMLQNGQRIPSPVPSACSFWPCGCDEVRTFGDQAFNLVHSLQDLTSIYETMITESLTLTSQVIVQQHRQVLCHYNRQQTPAGYRTRRLQGPRGHKGDNEVRCHA